MYHGRAEGSIEAVGNADERRTAFYKDLYAKSKGIVVYGFRNDCSLFFYICCSEDVIVVRKVFSDILKSAVENVAEFV